MCSSAGSRCWRKEEGRWKRCNQGLPEKNPVHKQHSQYFTFESIGIVERNNIMAELFLLQIEWVTKWIFDTHDQPTSRRFRTCGRFNPRPSMYKLCQRPGAKQRHSILRLYGGHMPGRLKANIALPGYGHQMIGLERPQRNGDKNKNEKDQAENREPLPSGIERRNLIPWTSISAPHKEN